ncbi:MAG: hypothetical protein ACOCYN_04410 [Planctomycetota bacterium]
MPHDPARPGADLSDEDRAVLAYAAKSEAIRSVLADEHEAIMTSVRSFHAGGELDLYYYPNYNRGTAIATKEVADPTFSGPANDCFDSYELVMFTPHAVDLDALDSEHAPDSFAGHHQSINAFLNAMARCVHQGRLNPGQQVEFPAGTSELGGRCLIVDDLCAPMTHPAFDGNTFGLMLLIEIHHSELEFADAHGGTALLERLHQAGVYPFSTLHRDPVA